MKHNILQAINKGSLVVRPSSGFVGEVIATFNTSEGLQTFTFESGTSVDVMKAFTKDVVMNSPQFLGMLGKQLQVM